MRQQLHGRFTCGIAARPGHVAIPVGLLPQLRVRVDGDTLRAVVACDTWQGWADYLCRDDHGEFVMLAGAAQLKRAHGPVEAVLLDADVDDVDVLMRRGLVLG